MLLHRHFCRGVRANRNTRIVNVRPPDEAMSLVITEAETMPDTFPFVKRDYVNQRNGQFQTFAYLPDVSSRKCGPAKHTPHEEQNDYS